MNCKEIRKHFPVFLKGDLTGRIKEIISSHIDNCESCRREFEQYLALNKIISKAKTTDKDGHFWEQYIQELEDKLDTLSKKKEKEAIRSVELPFYLRKSAYAFAALLLLAAGIITFEKFFHIDEKMSIEDITYSNSLEFFMEEFNTINSENIFSESFPFDEEDFGLLNNND